MPDTTVRAGQERSPRSYDEDVVLVDYLVALWKRGWVLLGAAVLFGLVAFSCGRTSPPIYEASVKMVVSAPKTIQVGEVAAPMSVATVRAMIENQSLAAQVVKEFRLDAAPLRLTPQSFLSNALSLDTPRDTSVVVLRVRLANRELPAKVANRLAELTIALAERLSQEETVRTRDYIKAQVDQSRARLQEAEARLGEFRQRAQIEALRKDVEGELDQRSGLLSLQLQIETQRARIARAEKELAGRQRIRTIKRSIDGDPALMEAAREGAKAPEGGKGSGVLGLEVTNEYLDRVYDDIDQDIARSRTELSGLEKTKAELLNTWKVGAAQLEKLNRLYSEEAGLERLETEYDLAKKVYLDVATRYEQVRLQVVGRSAQLQLLDAALVPDLPVGPRVLRNTAAAMVGGFVIAAILVLLWAAIAQRQPRNRLPNPTVERR